MKANELRIGNFVTYENVLHVVRVLYPNQVRVSPVATFISPDIPRDVYETEYSELFGIPLTPEVLEKCGFEAYHDERSIKIGHRYFLCAEPISDGMQVFTENTNLDDECKMYHSHIKHLHQLQNLYFALTGTELTYTP